MERVEYVEQVPGSDIITIFTESGNQYHIGQAVLESFIEMQGLNLQEEYSGNNAPLGDDNPEYDNIVDVFTDPADYLDNHLYQVCELYINDKHISNQLKHVA